MEGPGVFYRENMVRIFENLRLSWIINRSVYFLYALRNKLILFILRVDLKLSSRIFAKFVVMP